MPKIKSIKELLKTGGARLTDLRARAAARSSTLDHVRGSLEPKLAENVVSAGLEHGRLTIGVTAAIWASRLRYLTEEVRQAIATAEKKEVQSVRIKVVPPP